MTTSAPPAGAPMVVGEQRWVPQNRWDLAIDDVRRAPARPAAIIVTHFEQADSLRRMYAALEAASLDPHRFELIVVDDGSAHPPSDPPLGFALPFRVLRQPARGCRPGAARNLGAAATSAEVLVFLDADTLPEPTTVERLAAWPSTVPDALVVGRRGHVDLDGWTPAATSEWLRGTAPPPPRRSDPEWLERGYVATRDLLDADDRSFQYVISAVMACHRSLYEDIGGFDADRDEYGGEDWEFASRAFNAGAVLVHDRHAMSWHDEPDWADRSGATPAAKQSETLWLARSIAEPATRGPGIIQHFSGTIARLDLPADTTVAQFVVTVAAILAAVPDVGIHLRPPVPEAVRRHVHHDPRIRFDPPSRASLLRARTLIDVGSPAQWETRGLRSVIDAVRPGGAGVVRIVDRPGHVGAVVASSRAMRRAGRIAELGVPADEALVRLFGAEIRSALDVGLRPVPPDVDLAAAFREMWLR